MPRRHRRPPAPERPAGPGSLGGRSETWRGLDYTVRSALASDRVYRCPGCDQEIQHVAHVVVWPGGDPEDRRHWHTACWAARDTRSVTRRWS